MRTSRMKIRIIPVQNMGTANPTQSTPYKFRLINTVLPMGFCFFSDYFTIQPRRFNPETKMKRSRRRTTNGLARTPIPRLTTRLPQNITSKLSISPAAKRKKKKRSKKRKFDKWLHLFLYD